MYRTGALIKPVYKANNCFIMSLSSDDAKLELNYDPALSTIPPLKRSISQPRLSIFILHPAF